MERILPENLRHRLKKPFGKLVPDIAEIEAELKSKNIISVGDKVTESVLKSGIVPMLCIYDGKTKRLEIGIPAEIKKHAAKEIRVNNPAGTITTEAFDAIKQAIKSGKKTKILVDGEEDLLTLAAIKTAPPGSVVLYGQPDEGIVMIVVDDKTKNKVEKILGEMIEK